LYWVSGLLKTLYGPPPQTAQFQPMMD